MHTSKVQFEENDDERVNINIDENLVPKYKDEKASNESLIKREQYSK